MKTLFFLLLGFIVLIPVGWTQDTGYGPESPTSRLVRDTKARRDIIYGYSPYFLSGSTQYSYTPEQEGHYILGQTERPLPRMPDVRVAPATSIPATPGVLVSAPNRQTNDDELPARPQAGEPEKREPRINDSQGIEDEISRHTWTTMFDGRKDETK